MICVNRLTEPGVRDSVLLHAASTAVTLAELTNAVANAGRRGSKSSFTCSVARSVSSRPHASKTRHYAEKTVIARAGGRHASCGPFGWTYTSITPDPGVRGRRRQRLQHELQLAGRWQYCRLFRVQLLVRRRREGARGVRISSTTTSSGPGRAMRRSSITFSDCRNSRSSNSSSCRYC